MSSSGTLNGEAMERMVAVLEALADCGGCEDASVLVPEAHTAYAKLCPGGQQIVQELLKKPALKRASELIDLAPPVPAA